MNPCQITPMRVQTKLVETIDIITLLKNKYDQTNPKCIILSLLRCSMLILIKLV